MGVIHLLSSFALRQLIGDGTGSLTQALTDHVGDTGQRLLNAIRRANERSWKTLEVVLAGESLWNRLDRAEERAFRDQIQAFLNSLPQPEMMSKAEFRRECLRELREARQAGLLLGPIVAGELLDRAGAFSRFVDPSALLEAEQQALRSLAGEVERGGHRTLAWLVSQPVQSGQSLLVMSVRYFFRREVEADPLLSRRLSLVRLEEMTQGQQEGFARLEVILTEQGELVEQALEGLTVLVSELREQVAQIAEHLRDPERPSPVRASAPRELSCSAEQILVAVRRFLPQDDLHLAPDIPPRKLATARRTCQVPTDEVILVLIDATVIGTARAALLLGRAGLYYHNDHGSKVAGPGFVPYGDLVSRKIQRESWAEVSLDRGEFFNRSGSQMTADRLVELLLALQREIQP